jgi:hypothetical protein
MQCLKEGECPGFIFHLGIILMGDPRERPESGHNIPQPLPGQFTYSKLTKESHSWAAIDFVRLHVDLDRAKYVASYFG